MLDRRGRHRQDDAAAARARSRAGGRPDRPCVFLAISNPTLTRAEFIEYLADAFGLSPAAGASKARFLIELERALLAHRRADTPVALVVDEAQSLPDELLEEIRLLANIETDTEKLLPLILVGQPELADRLNAPALHQLKQRIALRCRLEPLALAETASYVATRISIAGGTAARVFTREAVRAVHARSGGVPRLINVICDNALVSGFALDRRPVGEDIVAEVGADFDLPAEPAPRPVAAATAEPTASPGVQVPAAVEAVEESEPASRSLLGLPFVAPTRFSFLR